jgi:hypothetical protein
VEINSGLYTVFSYWDTNPMIEGQHHMTSFNLMTLSAIVTLEVRGQPLGRYNSTHSK